MLAAVLFKLSSAIRHVCLPKIHHAISNCIVKPQSSWGRNGLRSTILVSVTNNNIRNTGT